MSIPKNFKWSDPNNYGSDGTNDPLVRGRGQDKFGQVYIHYSEGSLDCISDQGVSLGAVTEAEVEAFMVSFTGLGLTWDLWEGHTMLQGGEYIIGHGTGLYQSKLMQVHVLYRCRDGQKPEMVGVSYVDNSKRFEDHDAYIMGKRHL